jgi:isoamylase
MFNAHDQHIEFRLPAFLINKDWEIVLDTSDDDLFEKTLNNPESIRVEGRAVVVLRNKLFDEQDI